MSSTLVETVSINYEDFNDSFLTCGTCLCMFDSQEHTPKLLHCSHTVCRSCLEHILEAQGRNPTSFRCPICRETINVPRGGVTAFPPSFIVNQLLDLMARQRRDIIPKCSEHSQQELMFCETCDTVFCVECSGGSHNGRGASAHTVIPFSIAIKRMSEILLYKASLCMRNLNNACENVGQEMRKLDVSADLCIEAISKTFQDLMNMVDQRRHDVIQTVKRIRDDKKQVLREQLDIIEAEKTKVQVDCQGLQHQVEVRNITKRISDLNEKLDISTTLAEPRENAYMKFETKHNNAQSELNNALNFFGRIKISKTFPALCTAQLEQLCTHLKATVSVLTVDYHGNPRTTGSDPLVVELKGEKGEVVPTEIKDYDNGTYKITFMPLAAGRHKLSVTIFDRPLRDSPFQVDVTDHKNPCTKVGHRGSGQNEFIQPINVVLHANKLFVLDTGNSRIKVLDLEGKYLRQLTGYGLEQRGCTSMAMTANGNLLVVNWRTKYVTELALDGVVVNKFTCSSFVEPVSLTVNSQGEIYVADNGVNKIWVFDRQGKLISAFGGTKGDKDGHFKLITSMYTTLSDDIIVTDNRLQVFSRSGQFLHRISASPAKGQYGGITIDCRGNYLASHQGRAVVQVFNAKRQWVFDIDSFTDKMKRPSGLVTTPDGHVYVVDLGNDCVKKFRYM